MFPGTIDQLIDTLKSDEKVGIAVPVLNGTKPRHGDYAFF
jgi:hypothetical protein